MTIADTIRHLYSNVKYALNEVLENKPHKVHVTIELDKNEFDSIINKLYKMDGEKIMVLYDDSKLSKTIRYRVNSKITGELDLYFIYKDTGYVEN